MKVIKFQAWEESFQKRILKLRDLELRQLLKYATLNCCSVMLWTSVPLMVALATFTTYTLSGHELDVASALTALALFDILRFPLFMLPQVINDLVEASVSIQRIQTFLLCEEHESVPLIENFHKEGLCVLIQNATFIYDSNKPINPYENKYTRRNDGGLETLRKLHESEWEIKLLKAQLADAEHKLLKVRNELNLKTDSTFDVSSTLATKDNATIQTNQNFTN
jgi:ABC-type multidrug transport system fused ATPase/permease subunit